MTESAIIQPEIAAKSPNKKLKFIIGGVIIIAAVIFLVAQSISSTGAYYMTVADLNAQAGDLMGQKIRVSGAVVQESEDWNAPDLILIVIPQVDRGFPIHNGHHPVPIAAVVEIGVVGAGGALRSTVGTMKHQNQRELLALFLAALGLF
jgi:hypothetical protein